MKLVVKRNQGDRRKSDKGPPTGWQYDGRRQAERRAIEVEEISLEEFQLWLPNHWPKRALG